jgi:hypothetical protein
MPLVRTFFRIGLSAGAIATLFSGCSSDIELNGKIFDWLGVSPAAQEAAKREPKLAQRAPLVMPPDVTRLPEPGSAPAQLNAAEWPDDPEQRKLAAAKERERLHLAYCRGELNWQERVLKKDDSAPRSPYGPCPSLLGDVTKTFNNK